jgi:hypothetical protein
MGIGIIGASPTPAPGKALVESNFYDSTFLNIPFELEAGAYRVSAVDNYTLDSNLYFQSDTVVSTLGVSNISVPDRSFLKVGGTSAFYNDTNNFGIQFMMPALDGDTKFTYAINSTYVSTLDDKDPTGESSEWSGYTTLNGNAIKRAIKSPHQNRYLAFGSAGYLYYFNSDGKSLSYFTQSNNSSGQTQSQAINGVIFGASTWIAYQDDYRVIVSNNIETSSASGGYDLGLGSSDLDSGGYINGNYVVVSADGTYLTASEGNLASWTNRGQLTWIRKTGGSNNAIFTYNNKLWAASTDSSTTPFYSSTDGITWAPDTSISVPFSTGVYGVLNVTGSQTLWAVYPNSSTNGGLFITEDFATYTSGLGPSSDFTTSRQASLGLAGDVLYVNSNISKVLTGDRVWTFETIGPAISAN